jgi:hypothetical protein
VWKSPTGGDLTFAWDLLREGSIWERTDPTQYGLATQQGTGAVFVRIPGVVGDATNPGYTGWLEATAFAQSVDRPAPANPTVTRQKARFGEACRSTATSV